MAHIAFRLLAILSALAVATPALAQDTAVPAVTVPANATAPADTTAQVQATPPQTEGPTFWLFGVPIRPSAPVPPPYEGTAYNDLGGQPMTSVDQVMSQQFTGQQQ
jgi:hypothetical protein